MVKRYQGGKYFSFIRKAQLRNETPGMKISHGRTPWTRLVKSLHEAFLKDRNSRTRTGMQRSDWVYE